MNLSREYASIIQEAHCAIVTDHEFYYLVCAYEWLDFNYTPMALETLILLGFMVIGAFAYLLMYQHRRW